MCVSLLKDAQGKHANVICSTALLIIDGDAVDRVTSLRDLGIYSDANLVMWPQVQRTVSRCFAALRPLRQISHSVPPPMFQSPVFTLVLSRLI